MEYIINDDYMTSKAAAIALGISRGYVWRLVQMGVLEGVVYEHRQYITRASVAACDLTNLPGKGRPRKNEIIDATIGLRCREAREASGLRFSVASKELDLSESALSLKERGLRPITALELSKMATLYGVSAKWLECGNESTRVADS